jgi:hypothetical protein
MDRAASSSEEVSLTSSTLPQEEEVESSLARILLIHFAEFFRLLPHVKAQG